MGDPCSMYYGLNLVFTCLLARVVTYLVYSLCYPLLCSALLLRGSDFRPLSLPPSIHVSLSVWVPLIHPQDTTIQCLFIRPLTSSGLLTWLLLAPLLLLVVVWVRCQKITIRSSFRVEAYIFIFVGRLKKGGERVG